MQMSKSRNSVTFMGLWEIMEDTFKSHRNMAFGVFTLLQKSSPERILQNIPCDSQRHSSSAPLEDFEERCVRDLFTLDLADSDVHKELSKEINLRKNRQLVLKNEKPASKRSKTQMAAYPGNCYTKGEKSRLGQ